MKPKYITYKTYNTHIRTHDGVYIKACVVMYRMSVCVYVCVYIYTVQHVHVALALATLMLLLAFWYAYNCAM